MDLDRTESLQQYILNNMVYEPGTANNDRVALRQSTNSIFNEYYNEIYAVNTAVNTNELRFKPKIYDLINEVGIWNKNNDDTECELERETPMSKELVSSELDSFLCSLRKKEVV